MMCTNMITYIINTVRSATDSKGFEIPFCSQWQHLELNNLEGSTPPSPTTCGKPCGGSLISSLENSSNQYHFRQQTLRGPISHDRPPRTLNDSLVIYLFYVILHSCWSFFFFIAIFFFFPCTPCDM